MEEKGKTVAVVSKYMLIVCVCLAQDSFFSEHALINVDAGLCTHRASVCESRVGKMLFFANTKSSIIATFSYKIFGKLDILSLSSRVTADKYFHSDMLVVEAS